MNWEELIEQLTDFGVTGMEQTGLPAFVIAMLASLACALFVAYLYSVFYKSRASGSQIHRAFPLLGISVTAIFITIQFSLPLSLGLLGALSIVRFRTPIKEPEEIAFLMLVVATSLCCATFNLLFLTIILVTAVAALLLMRSLRGIRRTAPGHGMIVINVPLAGEGERGAELGGALVQYLLRELPTGRVDSVTDGEDEATVSFHFTSLEPERIDDLQAGVRNIAAQAICHVYYDHTSGA